MAGEGGIALTGSATKMTRVKTLFKDLLPFQMSKKAQTSFASVN